MSTVKRIKFFPRIAIGTAKDSGEPVLWGFVEYLLNLVFNQDALFKDKDFAEMVLALHPRLVRLAGAKQEGQHLDMSKSEHEVLAKTAFPSTHNQLPQDLQYLTAHARIAINSAAIIEIPDEAPQTPESPSQLPS